jgi:hypothetical protein
VTGYDHPGFTAVTHDSTGVYCLTPETGIDSDTTPAVVSPDHFHSSGSDLQAYVNLPVSHCDAGKYEVRTSAGTGAVSDNVAFTIIVP